MKRLCLLLCSAIMMMLAQDAPVRSADDYAFGLILYADYTLGEGSRPSPWVRVPEAPGFESEYRSRLWNAEPVSPQAVAELDRYRESLRSLPSPTDYQRQLADRLDRFQQSVELHNRQVMEGAFAPSPVPAGVSAETVARDLKPLRDSMEAADPLAAAKAVSLLQDRIAAYTRLSSQPGFESMSGLAATLNAEAARVAVNSQGLLKGLPHHEAPLLSLAHPADSATGRRLRARINESMAAGSVLSYACSADAACGEELAGELKDSVDGLVQTYFALDHLARFTAHTGSPAEAAVRRALDELDPVTASLVGLAQGVLEGSAGLVSDSVEAAKLLLTDAPAVVDGLYQAIVHYDRTWEAVKTALADRADALLNAETAEERARLVGRMLPEIALTAFGGAAQLSKIRHLTQGASLFSRAGTKALVRAAVESTTVRLQQAGTLAESVGSTIRKLSRREPFVGRALLRQLPSIESRTGGDLARTERFMQDLEASTGMRRALAKPADGGVDFYVRPSGEAVPGTAYRYEPSNAAYVQDLIDSGVTPPSTGGRYASFDRYDSMSQAARAVQVPHDCRYRVEFDMRDQVETTRIPNGQWGKADYLEPLTSDHPQFGEGGATQALVFEEIRARRIVDLKTGEVVFERSPQ